MTAAGAVFVNGVRAAAIANGGGSFNSTTGSGTTSGTTSQNGSHTHTFSGTGTLSTTANTSSQNVSASFSLPSLTVTEQSVGSGSAISVANAAIHLFAMIKD